MALAIGLGILGGRSWALAAAMALAILSALTQFLFLPFFPLWSLVIIAFDVLVIWALANQWQRR